MKFFKTKVLLWPMLLLVGAVAAAGIFGVVTLWLASPFSVATQSRSTQVVEAMERKGDVVLLAMSVVAVDDDKTNLKFYGLDVPGSDRATFLRYEFDAKLGFAGADVEIDDAGDNHFVVSIPRFAFIGYDNFDSEVAAEKNGLISWLTPAIDDREMAEKFLNDEKEQEYVIKNIELLKEEAQAFYTDIVSAVDPNITLEFEFAD
ncbi:hypothetical protein [uncultured Microbacterium sp.]|uniref:hypothetical protein n=1 Tax=uncultured Microbacterium sp. TaxID=191216 RepID=UPI002624A4D5|nr:hypothetical protein [uncultured Microbacterium sp.]